MFVSLLISFRHRNLQAIKSIVQINCCQITDKPVQKTNLKINIILCIIICWFKYFQNRFSPITTDRLYKKCSVWHHPRAWVLVPPPRRHLHSGNDPSAPGAAASLGLIHSGLIGRSTARNNTITQNNIVVVWAWMWELCSRYNHSGLS